MEDCFLLSGQLQPPKTTSLWGVHSRGIAPGMKPSNDHGDIIYVPLIHLNLSSASIGQSGCTRDVSIVPGGQIPHQSLRSVFQSL